MLLRRISRIIRYPRPSAIHRISAPIIPRWPQLLPASSVISYRLYASASQSLRITLDEQIPAGEVRYIDAAGKFQGILPLRQVLSSINRQTHHIMCVNPSASPPLVCKAISKEDLQAQQTQRYQDSRKKKPPAIVHKEIEMSWAISQHDLGHRLRKLEEFLRKGNRVTIMLGTKKGMQKQVLGAMQNLVKQIQEAAGTRGKEMKPPEGMVGKKYMLFYEGIKEEKNSEEN